MTTLISFLGKGIADKKTGYKLTRYDFGDTVREVPYFGLALTEALQPDRLILIGTAGSTWDVFFEQQGADDEGLMDLIEAVAQARVDEPMLEAYARRLEAKLGCPVTCLLIPYARNEAEQIEILGRLAAKIEQKERIVLDVTHGFRHLPMLALVAARYLRHVRGVEIEGIYYGALEMTEDNKTPVLRLDGLLRMLDWVEALATYDKDGDYGVFAPLLEKSGLPPDKAQALARAAFYERTSNPVKAREVLTGAAADLEAHTGRLFELFKDALKQRIAWFRKNSRDEWERELSDAYLKRRDYLRAAIFLYEAAVSRAAMEKERDVNDYDEREASWREYRKGNQAAGELEYLRNTLAHGVKSQQEWVSRVVADQQRLPKKLQELCIDLLGR